MQLTFRFKRELIERARKAAARRGTTLEELLQRFIAELATTKDAAAFLAQFDT